VGAAELTERLAPQAIDDIPVGHYVPLLEFNPYRHVFDFAKKSRHLFTMNFHSALPADDTVFVQSDFTSVRLCLGKPDSQGN
jgi:hypothetical protein